MSFAYRVKSENNYNLAIVLSGGKGTRMGGDLPKQYLELAGKPVLVHTLQCFAKSDLIDEIIIVAASEYIDYCREQIVSAYDIEKVSRIIAGGKERYDSVYEGLSAFRREHPDTARVNVFIHDGARPLLDDASIKRAAEAVEKYRACAIGVPAKDTIKICDKDGKVEMTPDRSTLWSVQTPQVFQFDLIMEGHEKLHAHPMPGITDDAMIVEQILRQPVYMVMGTYQNIKITTPEDMVMAEAFLTCNCI